MAGKIARDAGLADQSGYCPIDPESMKSKVDANIFVVGDAAIPGDMPKSAFSANSQAKVAAMVIRAELTQVARFPGTLFQHLLEPDRARRRHQGRRELRAGRRQDQGRRTGFVSQKGEAADLRKQNYKESVDWYNGIVADIFG